MHASTGRARPAPRRGLTCSSPCARRNRSPGYSASIATISRSRLTLASTLAAAMHAAAASPPITGSDGIGSPGTRKPSDSTYPGRIGKPGHRAPHALDVGDVHAAPVDLARRHEHHVVGQRVPADQRKQRLARFLGQLLASRRDRPGSSAGSARAHRRRSPAVPAHAPRPTSSTPATGPSPLLCSADSSVRRPDDLRITARGGHVPASARLMLPALLPLLIRPPN